MSPWFTIDTTNFNSSFISTLLSPINMKIKMNSLINPKEDQFFPILYLFDFFEKWKKKGGNFLFLVEILLFGVNFVSYMKILQNKFFFKIEEERWDFFFIFFAVIKFFFFFLSQRVCWKRRKIKKNQEGNHWF